MLSEKIFNNNTASKTEIATQQHSNTIQHQGKAKASKQQYMNTPYLSAKGKNKCSKIAGVWTKEDVLSAFKDLFDSPLCKYLRKVNKDKVPLSIVGHFLNQVGSHFLRHCAKLANNT